MRVYKLEVMVMDFEGVGDNEIKLLIENAKYLNAQVMGLQYTNVDWHDDHPLNKCGTQARAYHDLFPINYRPLCLCEKNEAI